MRQKKLTWIAALFFILSLLFFLKKEVPIESTEPIPSMTQPDTPTILSKEPTCNIKNVEFKDSKKFWNETDEAETKQVYVKGSPIGWAVNRHCFDQGAILQFWSEQPSDMNSNDGSVYGSPQNLSWILSGSGKIIQLSLEGFDYISNPSFCGNLIAYWSVKPTGSFFEISLRIYNIIEDNLQLTKFLGADEVITDDAEYFDTPQWDASCKQVTFETTIQDKPVKETISVD